MVFITAEIGINHNGDIELAKKLIDVAVEAKCNAVKFQKRTVEKVYSKLELDKPRESQWGTTNREQKIGLEFGEKEFGIIDKYCKKLKIEWFASAWDNDSQIFLRNYNCKYNKVASAMLTNIELLKLIAEEGKHTFIATGMSTMKEISDAVNIFRDHECQFELMHTNSSYPMKEEEANLLCIPMLKKEFNCNVGYSGHEDTGYLVCVTAAVLGATSIERHITLSRSMYGSDQAASLERTGLLRMTRDVRKISTIMGDGKKRIWPSEIPVLKKLRTFST
jgi:N-acetylneuraminate synthase